MKIFIFILLVFAAFTTHVQADKSLIIWNNLVLKIIKRVFSLFVFFIGLLFIFIPATVNAYLNAYLQDNILIVDGTKYGEIRIYDIETTKMIYSINLSSDQGYCSGENRVTLNMESFLYKKYALNIMNYETLSFKFFEVVLGINKTGGLKVTVNDWDDDPRSSAKCVLYNRYGGQMGPDYNRTTDFSGEAEWTDLYVSPYYVEAYYSGPTPFIGDDEFWVSKKVLVTSDQKTSDILKRNRPYASNVDVRKTNSSGELLNSSSVIYPGTIVWVGVTVTNNYIEAQNCKVKLILDRNKSGAYDIDVTESAVQTVNGNGGVKLYEFTFQPTQAGQYSFAVRTTTYVEKKYVKTDAWDWLPTFTFLEYGDLEVTVQNWDESARSRAKCVLYNSSYQSMGSRYDRTTNSSGKAVWTGLSAGNYNVEAYYSGLTPFTGDYEFWVSKLVSVTSGQRTSDTLKRNRPYASSVEVRKMNSSGELLNSSSVIYPSTAVWVGVIVTNSYIEAQNCKVKLILDRDKTGAYDIDVTESAVQAVSGNGGTKRYEFTFQPTQAGQYNYAVRTTTYVNGNYVKTDAWDWLSTFTFREGYDTDIYSRFLGEHVDDSIISVDRNDGKGFVQVSKTGLGGSPVQVTGLLPGDKLRASKLVYVEPAVKQGHESVDNAMFELWVDSDVMNPDGSYNSYEIKNETNAYFLDMIHPTFKYNLVASVEWDGVSYDYYSKLDEGFKEASKFLYNATDGQVCFNKIVIYDGKNHWVDADIQIHPAITPITPGFKGIDGTGLDFLNISYFEKIHLGEKWDRWGHNAPLGDSPKENDYFSTIVHEFGHYAFGLYDEYKNGIGLDMRKHQREHPDEYPDNYGLMKWQYTYKEISSHNDYLKSYPPIPNPLTVTQQLFRLRMPCWDWIKQKLEGYYPAVIITMPPPGWYENRIPTSPDRLGPDDEWIKRNTEVLDRRTETSKIVSAQLAGPFESSIRILYNKKPVSGTHVYVVTERDRMFLGKTSIDGYIDWPGAYTGVKIHVYKIVNGKMIHKVIDVNETQNKYVFDLSEPSQQKIAEKQVVQVPGVALEADVSYSVTLVSINLSLLTDTTLSKNPQGSIYYADTSKNLTFTKDGSTDNKYTCNVTIDSQTPEFDGEGYFDILITDFSSNQNSFTSYFKLFPVSDTELNEINIRGLNVNVDEQNISKLQLGISLATLTVPYAQKKQILYPVTEIFTVKFENDNSFSEPSGLNISYLSSEVEGFDERTLGIYKWNSSQKTWDLLEDCYLDVGNNVISALINSTGIFTVFATAISSDITPPGKINDIGATTGQGQGKVVLNWTAPGDDEYSGRATNYIIKFNVEQITTLNWDTCQDITNTPTPSKTGTKESITITLPSSNLSYYFAIKTEDENGNLSELSNISFATSGIQNYTFSLISPSYNEIVDTLTPTLQWEHFTEDSLVTYTLLYNEKSDFTSKNVIKNISTDTYTFQIPLKNTNIYYWKVFASTTESDTILCNQPYLRFSTLSPISLEPPSNVEISDAPYDQGHSLLITWNPSLSESENKVEWYRIYRSRYYELTNPILLTQITSPDSLLSKEEHYTILIDSVRVGNREYIDTSVPLNNVTYYYWIQAVGFSSESQKIAANIIVSVEEKPIEFCVKPPYPNPFNPYTTIQYQLPFNCHVELVIYDILGRKITILENSRFDAGTHKSTWNGKDEEGNNVSSGVYFYLLKADMYIKSGKMVLLR